MSQELWQRLPLLHFFYLHTATGIGTKRDYNWFLRNFADSEHRGNDSHHTILLSEPLTRFLINSSASKISEVA
jgi:hypothetical protein